VIVPLERTFLLNPHHRDFRKIKITDRGDLSSIRVSRDELFSAQGGDRIDARAR